MKKLFYGYAFCCLLSSTVNAANEAPDWHSCIEMKDKVSVESELNCYRQVAPQKEEKKKR
jgi:hypothetical protein